MRLSISIVLNVDSTLVNDIVSAVSQSNVMLKFTNKEGSLSTAARRGSYIMREFPVVMPFEFVLDKKANLCTSPY